MSADQPLTVTWSMPEQAKAAELETDDFGPVTIPDNGAFQIPGANNPANPSQRIFLFRFNEVDIAGGLLGSRMRVRIKEEVEPVIVQ